MLGEQTYTSLGLPNTGSQSLEWPGLQLDADPSFADVLSVRRQRLAQFDDFVRHLDFAELPATVEIDENGSVPTVMCFHVVLEEEFEHLRYALRDLDLIDAVTDAG